MRSSQVTNHLFSQIPNAEIPRSSFNRSHGHKTTFNAGYLVPIFVDEALPGDTFNLKMTAFCRLATPIYPIMDNLYLETFFFAVPNRLVWDNWQRFNGERVNPDDTTDYVIPQASFPAGGYDYGSLQDYLGIPPKVQSLPHSNLFCRAYNLVYNEWFRDQNLQNSVVVDMGDGPDNPANYVLLRRGKRHDYFTSCLPWPQKGPAVNLPLGDVAPVVSTNAVPRFKPASVGEGQLYADAGANPNLYINGTSTSTFDPVAFGSVTGLEADLSTATAATINELRQAFQIQRMYERDARGGTRYIEIIKAHFNVTSPDARLQRPEYLGGGSTMINIHPVPQTSESDVTPLAQLAAFGTASVNNHGFTKSFTEHCIVIGLVNVRADLTYQQGLERMFSRRTRFDFYWPALSHLGEQAVLNKEIYADPIAGTDDLVFGYQERYAEYRYKPSRISGEFRSSFPQSLDGWHLAQDFGSLPVLNSQFIVDNPPMARVKAVTTEPDFIGDFFFAYRCARPMPVYSVPGLIDHF